MFDKLSLELDNPKINIKDLEINKISTLIGSNGSGKSLIMKMIWVCNIVLHAESLSVKVSLIDSLQFTLDNTFYSQTFTGKINYYSSTTNMFFQFEIVEGKVIDVDCDIKNKVLPYAIFMSTETRLFSNIILNLKIINISYKSNILDPVAMDKVLKDKLLPLYDLLFIIRFINYYSSNKIPKEIKETLKNTYSIEIENIKIDLISPDIIIEFKDKQVSAKTLSNGHQSIILMTLGSAIT